MEQRDQVKSLSPPWLADDSPGIPGQGGGVGGRFMYNLGLASDGLLAKLNQAILARLPGKGDPSSLPILGTDRVMTQGPGETNVAFGLRLQRAFETWQRAGSARAVLEQAFSFLTGQTGASGQQPLALIVGGYLARKWDWLLASSDPTEPPIHFEAASNNFAWDGKEAKAWWRSWLVFFAYRAAPSSSGTAAAFTTKVGGFVTVTGLTGLSASTTSLTLPGYLTVTGGASPSNSGTFQITAVLSPSSAVIACPAGVAPDANNGALSWAISYFTGLQPMPVCGFPGKTVGNGGNTNMAVGVQLPGAPSSSNTPAFFAQLRSLVRLWKSAQTWYPFFILSFSGGNQTAGSEFSPYSGEGAGNPDGTWATWAKRVGGLDVVARDTKVPPLSQFDCFIDGSGYYPPRCTVQVT